METVFLLSSDSNEEENTTAKSPEFQKSKSDNSDDDGENWKEALLARDLDALHTCTLMIVSEIPSSQRLELSQSIADSLKYIKQIAFGKLKKEDSPVRRWKNSVLARNLDLIDTSLYIVMMDVPTSFREQLGKTIVAAVQDMEKVIKNDGSPAEQLIHCTGAENDGENNGKRNLRDYNDDFQKSSDASPPKLSRTDKVSETIKGPQQAPLAPHVVAEMKKMILEGTCPICYKVFPHQVTKCPACTNFATKMKLRLDEGFYLKCSHENNSGGVSCRSCRYNLYHLMVDAYEI
ncbi:hypothetical protein GE061_020073 [Apolygus lucorum]|uniref:Uncharacterized protein n=1 Tax=Apolygus lucorum TaxID=248454 RepID=A0A8S9XC99_APOLU|nr:hypothetical protein GE061_020073 [Apolygus lucorum]